MSQGKGFDPNKAIDQIKADRNLTIIAAGAAAVVIGIFLPWYSIDFLGFSTSASPGLGDGTGILLLVFAVGALASSLNVLNQEKRMTSIAALVMGVLATLIMLNNWPDNTLGDVVSIGIGYWLSLAGSLALVAGSVMRMQGAKAQSASASKTATKDKDSAE